MADTKGDPYFRTHAREPLEIQAEPWNRLLAIARDSTRLQGGGAPYDFARDLTVVKVRNDTGQDLQRFQVVQADYSALIAPVVLPGVSSSANLPEFQRSPAWPALVPGSVDGTIAPLAVLLEPLAQGAIGRAAVAGVVPVRLHTSTVLTCDYADAIDGDVTRLNSQQSGPCRVIASYPDSPGSTEGWAYVRLGDPPGLSTAQVGLTTPQAVSNGGSLDLTWGQTNWDTDGFFDVHRQPTRLTVPAGLGGLYLVQFAGIWYGPQFATTRWADIRRVGAGGDLGVVTLYAIPSDPSHLLSCTTLLDDGDWLTVRVYQTGSGSGTGIDVGRGAGADCPTTLTLTRLSKLPLLNGPVPPTVTLTSPGLQAYTWMGLPGATGGSISPATGGSTAGGAGNDGFDWLLGTDGEDEE